MARVVMTERQHELLAEMTASRRSSQGLALRAAIVLRAFGRERNDAIAARLGCERHTVGTWRRRWAAHFDRLVHAECLGKPGELRRAIEAALADAPRPGRRCRITPEQVAMILAVACEPPEKSGVPRSHWTHASLADEVKTRGILADVSARHVGRFLKDGGPPAAPQRVLAQRQG